RGVRLELAIPVAEQLGHGPGVARLRQQFGEPPEKLVVADGEIRRLALIAQVPDCADTPHGHAGTVAPVCPRTRGPGCRPALPQLRLPVFRELRNGWDGSVEAVRPRVRVAPLGRGVE